MEGKIILVDLQKVTVLECSKLKSVSFFHHLESCLNILSSTNHDIWSIQRETLCWSMKHFVNQGSCPNLVEPGFELWVQSWV